MSYTTAPRRASGWLGTLMIGAVACLATSVANAEKVGKEGMDGEESYSGAALVSAGKEEGFYVGGRFGSLNIDVKKKYKDQPIPGYYGTWDSGTDKLTGNMTGAALAAGYRFPLKDVFGTYTPEIRVEAEGSFFSVDIKYRDFGGYHFAADRDGSLDVMVLKGLGYVDFPIEKFPALKPYVMLGVGYVNYNEQGPTINGRDWEIKTSGISFDFGLGASYTFAENWAVDASFRTMMVTLDDVTLNSFFSIGADNGNTKIAPSMTASLFSLGVRYLF